MLWSVSGRTLVLKLSFSVLFKRQALHQRNSRISQFLDDPQLSLGLDWTSHRARLKRFKQKQQAHQVAPSPLVAGSGVVCR